MNNTNAYKQIHAENPVFGSRYDAGGLTSKIDIAIKSVSKNNIYSILDYGTGKGALVNHLRNTLDEKYLIDGYDPAVEEWIEKPQKQYKLVTCIDVLEHLEPSSIDAVLNEIKTITEGFCFLLIDLQPAVQYLQNGRNAHTLLAPYDWWAAKLSNYFPYNISFPIYNSLGFIQKYIFTGTRFPANVIPAMTFTANLRIFDSSMSNKFKER